MVGLTLGEHPTSNQTAPLRVGEGLFIPQKLG